ncbi:MAG: 3-dehydroquinate synthase [Chloroflexi bacterium]|nr:3-dehydroquinate synthase [Chloroflexota bacterium]
MLGAGQGLVLATGGGALVDAQNRAAVAGGCVVCLHCAEEELLRRLEGCQDRPMLWAGDPPERLRALLRARRPAYAELPHHLDVTQRSPAEVAEAVLALYRDEPTVLPVRTPQQAYRVHVWPGGIDRLSDLLAPHALTSPLAIVSDENVWALYGERALRGLTGHGQPVTPIVLPAGEQHKHLDNVRLLYDRFADAGLDRGSAVICLGGGVISDMAGFAAATYLRGIAAVNVPTTLLAAVDASVGGKVAVDHPRGKNLVGAFAQPLAVLIDPQVFATLPERERLCGLAEIIKAGVIGDPALFAACEAAQPGDWRTLVERALAVKIGVVEEDPCELGRRVVLNLGHTFAHAYELLSDYQLAHGLAVSCGVAAAAHLAELRGLCSTATRERIVAALRANGLPTTYRDHAPAAVYAAMATDKKRQGARLRFVLPRDIGDVVIDGDVPEAQVLLALERSR